MNQIDLILQIQKDLIKLYEHVAKIQDNQLKIWKALNNIREEVTK